MRVAVIDLGTNTFNLVIADQVETGMQKVFSKKLAAKLGSGAINANWLSPEAITRGITCLLEFKKDIEQHCPDQICAFATSAVRSANNGHDFVNEAKEKTGISIQVISGDKEAELIYYGILQSVSFSEKTDIVLDIGGGSNEFIICSQSGILWKQSFDLGTFRIIDRFKPEYPLSTDVIRQMELFFDDQLQPLFDACAKFKPKRLIGASGSFDSFRAMISHSAAKDISPTVTSFPISTQEMEQITKQICSLTLDEIAEIPSIDAIRVEIITVATVFVWYIVKRLEIQEIVQSSFSLKEGVINKMFNGLAI